MWGVFVSQTGGEVVSLCERLEVKPDVIITNDYSKLSNTTLDFIKTYKINLIILPKNPELYHYESLNLPINGLYCLHGFLRIMPPSICSKYNIYNGHPGLITEFPELKGKDPQEKAFHLKMKIVGSVIHKVTETVDDGEILYSYKMDIKEDTLDCYYETTRQTSLDCWVEFYEKSCLFKSNYLI